VIRPEAGEPGVREVTLTVDPAWHRRGIGTRLLIEVARLAGSTGAAEILITTRADNQAVLPLVLAAGLRGRIRMSADRLTVRASVRELSPAAR
jgi:ribosomal protein S18 acetylase RimI-like enzyme